MERFGLASRRGGPELVFEHAQLEVGTGELDAGVARCKALLEESFDFYDLNSDGSELSRNVLVCRVAGFEGQGRLTEVITDLEEAREGALVDTKHMRAAIASSRFNRASGELTRAVRECKPVI